MQLQKWPFLAILVTKMAKNGQEMAKNSKIDAKGCLRVLLTIIKARINKNQIFGQFWQFKVFFHLTKLSHVGTLKLCQKMPAKILRELHRHNHSFRRK